MKPRPHARAGLSRPTLHIREGRPAWRRWFPIIIALGLLAAAPIVSHAQGAGADSVLLTWTAVGDDSLTGTASAYDLRMGTSPISDAGWSSATQLSGVTAPRPSGSLESFMVRGLTRGTPYWFALKTRDDAGNWSRISNVLQWDWVFDTAPPAAPGGLAGAIAGSSIHLTWSANAEPDLLGYTVYRSVAAAGPFTAISGSPISPTEFFDSNVPAGASAVWYKVSASDVNGNESARSAALSFTVGSAQVVSSYSIETPYPNPSRIPDPVRIPVMVPATGVSLLILDIRDSGNRLVRRLDLSRLTPGPHTATWDGRNFAGRDVAPGAYRAWLIAGDLRQSVRLLRLP